MARSQQVSRQAVIDCLHPARLRYWLALHVGDRDNRHGTKGVENRLMFGQVEAAMHCRDERRCLPREHRERQVIEMEVQDVEPGSEPAHTLEHGNVQRHWVAHRVVETQRARPHRLELGRRAGIAAGEQRDIVAEGHELLSEPGNDALGASVQFRWDCLGQRCNLRDSHESRLLVNAVAGHEQTPAWSGVRHV
jgi:hypothetical protein